MGFRCWRIIVVTLLCLYYRLTFVSSVNNLEMCPQSGNFITLKLLVSLPFPNSKFPRFNPSWNEGDRILPALYLAIDQINNRTDLLPHHQLELVRVDGGCDIASTTVVSTAIGLFNMDGNRIVGMIGPGCSASSLLSGHVLNQPEIEIVHIHGGGSLLLSNRSTYTNSLGILGSTRFYVDHSVVLLKRNGWHNIAILFESGRIYYRSAKEDFVKTLNDDVDYNVTIRFESPVYSTFYPLNGVRESLSRIIFLFTELYHTRRILCLAYHKGLFYPAYQWIIFDHRLHEIVNASSSENITFSYDGKTYSCSPSALLDITLEAAFIMYHQLSLKSEKSTLANISFDEFLKLYNERAYSFNVPASVWAYSFYDAVWAWALVLQRLIASDPNIFHEFEYGNKTIASLVLEHFYDFQFVGMSGSIAFNRNSGFFDRPVDLYQIIDGKERRTASHNGTHILLIKNIAHQKLISDIVQADTSVSLILIVFFAVLLFLWFSVLVFLHVLTVVYRNWNSVKASDPKLTHFAFSGAYLLVFALMLHLFLQVKEHPDHVAGSVCHAVWVWMLPMGFTLLIGTVIIRTWRLYRIFTHYMYPGRFISTTALVTMLAVFMSVDIIIAVIWTATDPRTLIITRETIQNGPATELVTIRTCRSQYDSVWETILSLYRATLLVVMVTLTFLTCHIPIRTFATTSLRVFSYSFTTTFGIGFTLYYFFMYFASTTFRLNANILNAVLYTSTNIMLFLSILCVFGPPLLPILRGQPCVKTGPSHLSNRIVIGFEKRVKINVIRK